MTVIVCIDERRGMLFNNRRQSKDSVLLDDLKGIIGTKRLLCAPFSDKMLSEANIPHTSTEFFLDQANIDDFCFVENVSVRKYIDKIDTIIVYNWNRHYPADMQFETIPELCGFERTEIFEFKGNSHERITREIFRK